MPDYRSAFKGDTAFGEQEALQFLTATDADPGDPIGIINFFDEVFSDLLTPLIPIQVGLLSDQPFIQAAVAEYGSNAQEGWSLIITPYINDLNTGFFIPRTSALPPPAPPTVAPPISGPTSQLYAELLSSTGSPDVARKMTNALFEAVVPDLIAAGPASIAIGKPITVPPYIPA